MRRSILALVCLALLVLGLAPAAAVEPAAEPASSDVAVDLEGSWRFSRGDDPAWKDPAFDDSGWQTQQVPGTSAAQGFDSYDGYAWFRRSFELPADAEGVNLIASMGFIDDADEVYLNGVLIGASGRVDAPRKTAWFERRLYAVPAEAPIFGGTNTIAVRMYDMSGGGGWYRGPVGIFSKARLRAEVYGITAPPAPAEQTDAVRAVLAEQAEALAAGALDRYLGSLADGFEHDGQDRERRARSFARLLEGTAGLALVDSEVEVLRDGDELVVDTNRGLSAIAEDGTTTVLRPTRQEFLRFDPATLEEVGNRSRFFRDELYSVAEGRRREFNVYLPPSYHADPDQRFPVVYLLHGINGGNREWEARDIHLRIDALLAEHGLSETIVVMPDGESLWYRDGGGTRWRTAFITELVPLVDAEYRTIDSPNARGLTGISMGGNGAFSIGWDHPELFRSIGSHIGALTLGGNGQSAADFPAVRASRLTPEFLGQYSYFFDSCPLDDFGFAGGVALMRAQLTAKLVEHEGVIYPGAGRHNDDCWLPNLWRSFALHSRAFERPGVTG